MQKRFGLGAGVALLLAVAGITVAFASSASTSAFVGGGRLCERAWRVVPSPNPGRGRMS
jgi:hypothetical protein